jgi:hypothetical protein
MAGGCGNGCSRKRSFPASTPRERRVSGPAAWAKRRRSLDCLARGLNRSDGGRLRCEDSAVAARMLARKPQPMIIGKAAALAPTVRDRLTAQWMRSSSTGSTRVASRRKLGRVYSTKSGESPTPPLPILRRLAVPNSLRTGKITGNFENLRLFRCSYLSPDNHDN